MSASKRGSHGKLRSHGSRREAAASTVEQDYPSGSRVEHLDSGSTSNLEHQQLAQYNPNQALDIYGDFNRPSVFSTRRPKNIVAGLSSGLKNLVKGASLGIVALAGAPIYGAHQGGVGGFFKGLGAGVVMAVAFPVAGVTYGLTQAVRGVYHTPEAVLEKLAGRKWDNKSRVWKENWYSLDEEQVEVENLTVLFEEQKKELGRATAAEKSSSAASGSASGTVVDMTYYNILGVPADASPGEIRKSYYKLARDCHPDKNPDDPKASVKFQSLGDAYQVLGDEERRQEYDKYGKDAAENMSLIDANLFFTMLFGSEALLPYVGKILGIDMASTGNTGYKRTLSCSISYRTCFLLLLKMALFVENFGGEETDGSITEHIMEFEQRKREVELAILLRERLEGYVNASESERTAWRMKMTNEVRELCDRMFADAILEAVGWAYVNYSAQFLGKLDSFLGMKGHYAKFQATNRDLSNYWKTAGAVLKATLAARKLERVEESKLKVTTKDGSSSSEAAAAVPTEDKEGEEDGFVPPSAEAEKARVEGIKQLEETVPLILETILSVCLFDVEATVRKVAKKVLKDLATPIEIRRQRAEALNELGEILQREAEVCTQRKKNEKIDVMKQMQEAFIRATQENDTAAAATSAGTQGGDSL